MLGSSWANLGCLGLIFGQFKPSWANLGTPESIFWASWALSKVLFVVFCDFCRICACGIDFKQTRCGISKREFKVAWSWHWDFHCCRLWCRVNMMWSLWIHDDNSLSCLTLCLPPRWAFWHMFQMSWVTAKLSVMFGSSRSIKSGASWILLFSLSFIDFCRR